MNEMFNTRTRMSIFDGLVECMLNEGLISSYDIQKLQNNLKQKFNNIKIVNPTELEFKNHNFNYKSYSFVINVENNKEDENKLSKVLDLFGYHVSKKIDKSNMTKYQIEPKYPIRVNDILKKKDINYFYHISPTSKLKKIKKLGLAPRGNETTFFHPDDRIYLISSSIEQIPSIIKMLAMDKNINEKDFTVFKIAYDDNYDYYLDEFATVKNMDIVACFVLKNIPPNKLEIVK